MTSPAEDTDRGRSRRTEKQWRHEERELTSTHAFWGALVGLHGAVAGLAGVLAGQGGNSFPKPAFVAIGLLALVSMLGLARLNFLSRAADAARAEYFRKTSRKVWPEGFDCLSENTRTNELVNKYRRQQSPIEKWVMALFVLNSFVFGIAIAC